jgi:hypothetical protein
MKVILHHLMPMMNSETQPQRDIIRLREALVAAGVEAEFFRWYDSTQTADVLHFFGRIPAALVQLAHNKSMRVVFTDSVQQNVPGSPSSHWRWRLMVKTAKRFLPYQIVSNFDWESYQLADACVVETLEEADYVRDVFSLPRTKIHVVPRLGADLDKPARQLKALYEALPKTSR